MPGIDIGITCHELNIDPTYKPVKQKRRKLGPERATAVNEEVERLLKVGSIIELGIQSGSLTRSWSKRKTANGEYASISPISTRLVQRIASHSRTLTDWSKQQQGTNSYHLWMPSPGTIRS